jgi:DNA-3-methyladenine glycosylase I
MKRCGWVPDDELYQDYHDKEWGVPVYDDNRLFEMLTLEGAQAGLSWSTILKKREGYMATFSGFDPEKVARYSKKKVEKLLSDSGIVRNRLKIESTINNAKAVMKIQREFGSFSSYLWGLIGGKPIHNKFRHYMDIPPETPESKHMSGELKKRGFRFVGPTVCYAFMQAVGMVNDQETGCFRHRQLKSK